MVRAVAVDRDVADVAGAVEIDGVCKGRARETDVVTRAGQIGKFGLRLVVPVCNSCAVPQVLEGKVPRIAKRTAVPSERLRLSLSVGRRQERRRDEAGRREQVGGGDGEGAEQLGVGEHGIDCLIRINDVRSRKLPAKPEVAAGRAGLRWIVWSISHVEDSQGQMGSGPCLQVFWIVRNNPMARRGEMLLSGTWARLHHFLHAGR